MDAYSNRRIVEDIEEDNLRYCEWPICRCLVIETRAQYHLICGNYLTAVKRYRFIIGPDKYRIWWFFPLRIEGSHYSRLPVAD